MFWYDDYAREKFNEPEGWRWYHVTCCKEDVPEGFVKLTGAVVPIAERGKRKGLPNWSKKDKSTVRTHFIKSDDFKAWRDAKEQELGICQRCEGKKQITRVARADGNHEYMTCPRCEGTGKPREANAAV